MILPEARTTLLFPSLQMSSYLVFPAAYVFPATRLFDSSLAFLAVIPFFGWALSTILSMFLTNVRRMRVTPKHESNYKRTVTPHIA